MLLHVSGEHAHPPKWACSQRSLAAFAQKARTHQAERATSARYSRKSQSTLRSGIETPGVNQKSFFPSAISDRSAPVIQTGQRKRSACQTQHNGALHEQNYQAFLKLVPSEKRVPLFRGSVKSSEQRASSSPSPRPGGYLNTLTQV